MADSIENIADVLRAMAQSQPDRPAIETEFATTITYGELLDKAEHIAAGLYGANIVSDRKRPRIGMVFENGADMAVALLGVTLIGEAAPFFPGSTASEFNQYFKNTGIDALLVSGREKGPVVTMAEKQGLAILRMAEQSCSMGSSNVTAQPPAPSGNDIALVLMTSGSTGLPKIVPLSHQNVCTSAADVGRSVGLGPDDRCLSMWEQYHIGGLVDLLLAPLSSGGCIIVTKGFNSAQFFELLNDKKPTWFQGVPTTLNDLVRHASTHGINAKPSSLRLIRSVAAALAPSLMAEIADTFDVPVIQTLGMTEAGPLITSTALPPAIRKPGSVGRPGVAEVRIVGPGGKTLGADETGEVAVRGPNVFGGYENNDDANKTAFRDGWFFTGDIGYFDADNDLFLTGRIKQLINRGGEKINPQEVDDALLEHDAVAEAAAFSMPHKTLGEDIGIAVVLKNPVSVDELRSHLAGKLSAFKVPGQIDILEQMPRNPVGKIDRLALGQIAVAARTTSGYVAPRDEMEVFLTRLWARELSADIVGVYDDFSSLGGDSLSSMRILIALEEAMDDTVPLEIIEDFATVDQQAKALRAAGLYLDPAIQAKIASGDTVDSNIDGLLGAISTADAGLDSEDGGIREQLGAITTSVALGSFHDAMTVYRTPAELAKLLPELAGQAPGSTATNGPGFWAGLKLKRKHKRWCRRTEKDLRVGKDWQREVISDSVTLYSGPDTDDPAPTLLVGFTGNQHRLMMQTYRILGSLEHTGCDLLLLNDHSRKLFLGGAGGTAGNLDELCAFVQQFAEDAGYAKTVTLGTSGGGLAAIYSALKFGWSKAVTVGSASPARHNDFEKLLRDLAKPEASRRTAIIATYAANTRDTDAANQIKNVFDWAELRADTRFTNHNQLIELFDRDELTDFLADVLS